MQNYKVFALFFAFQACFFGHAIIRQYKKNSESSLGVSCGADGATTHMLPLIQNILQSACMKKQTRLDIKETDVFLPRNTG